MTKINKSKTMIIILKLITIFKNLISSFNGNLDFTNNMHRTIIS